MVAGMASSIQPTDRASYVRSGFVVAAALVLVVAVTAAVITDDAPTPRPQSLAGAAANGLIAYSYAGDIYVGDPATGETTAIVTNPIYEVNPMFSPDGERIAFIRGDPQTGESTIVVVRADGSDERVLLPKGREHRGFGSIAWTPDGDSLFVQLDTPPFTYPHDDGELSLFDSSGTGEERLITPPLATIARRPRLQLQHPRRADVPPARGRPHPVRRPKRAERVRS